MKGVAPWIRIAIVVILGMAVIYGIGRWDSRIARRSAELQEETDSFLERTRERRMFLDSIETLNRELAARDDSLAAIEAVAAARLLEVRQLARREVAELENTPVDSLLRPLRLEALELPPPAVRVVYATDEPGVRFLAGRMLRLAQVERELPIVSRMADTRALRIETLRGQVGLLTAARDSLAEDLSLAAPLLERWRAHNECQIFWVIDCPSRTASFVIGAVVGGLTVVALTRE